MWWWWRRPCVHTTTAFCLGERKLGTSMSVGDSLKTWNRCTCTVWIEGEDQHLLTMWLAVPRCFQDHWEGLLVTKDLYCWWHVSIFVRNVTMTSFVQVLKFQRVISTCSFVFMPQEAVFWHICRSVSPKVPRVLRAVYHSLGSDWRFGVCSSYCWIGSTFAFLMRLSHILSSRT